MRDMLTDAPGARGAEPRTLRFRVSDRLHAARYTSRVRVRWFTPGTTPPPLTHPLVLLREEGRLARSFRDIAEELARAGEWTTSLAA
jgi:hypothetical protein